MDGGQWREGGGCLGSRHDQCWQGGGASGQLELSYSGKLPGVGGWVCMQMEVAAEDLTLASGGRG